MIVSVGSGPAIIILAQMASPVLFPGKGTLMGLLCQGIYLQGLFSLPLAPGLQVWRLLGSNQFSWERESKSSCYMVYTQLIGYLCGSHI